MNYFAAGFFALALLAVGAIDYVNQAGTAAPGSYSARAHLASYGARLGLRGPDDAGPSRQMVEGTAPDPPPPPRRLELSGGASCLEASAGRFCGD